MKIILSDCLKFTSNWFKDVVLSTLKENISGGGQITRKRQYNQIYTGIYLVTTIQGDEYCRPLWHVIGFHINTLPHIMERDYTGKILTPSHPTLTINSNANVSNNSTFNNMYHHHLILDTLTLHPHHHFHFS